MNRILLPLAALLGALTPLIFDSGLKGVALLALSALCALALWRASAAARHLVWVVAVVALLIVPVLSVALPQWRVLPKWAVVPTKAAPVAKSAGPSAVAVTPVADRVAPSGAPPPSINLPASPFPRSGQTAIKPPSPVITEPHTRPEAPATWRDWIAPTWACGFVLLALRLLAAHLLLRRAARRCASGDEAFAATLSAACAQLGIRQRVILLMDEKRTIPVVWGVLRPRLLLPAEACEWSAEQLRSVLLHELAHIKRRDTLVQWLTQIACALHWWNPLVWLAAWRLHVERERACDDIVLASGVRPSAYAEHLLDVATKLSPARWTQACGLAMARKSSLEGRLLAVLSEKLNRRGITTAVAAAALVLGAAVAIPVAMLQAADETKAKEAVAKELNINTTAPADVSILSAAGTGHWRMPDGVTLELKQEVFPAAVVATSAVLTWPKDASGITYAYIIGLGADDFGNKEPWHLVWQNNATVLWAMSGQVQSRHERRNTLPTPISVRRIDFADKMKITTTAWSYQPEAMPEGVRAEFLKVFEPLPATPRSPSDAKGSVQIDEAHDMRPVADLMNGVWKNKDGPISVRLTFPEKDTDQIQWTIDFMHQKNSVLSASLNRILKPAENAVGLWAAPSVQTNLNEEDILGRVRRGPDDTLLLDITPNPKYPGYDAAKGIVLVREGGSAQADPPAASPATPSSPSPFTMKPKHKYAQSLFSKWQANARTDGKIPGALIGHVAKTLDDFVRQYPANEATPKFVALRSKFDKSHDWEQAEVVALLDEVTAISTAPVSWADTPMESSEMWTVRQGEALPIELKSAAWGEPAPNGLRAAWLLQPRAEQYRLGSVLKARVLFNNTGTKPVIFKTESWHQDDRHSARDANGSAINVGSTFYTGSTPMATYRLVPGEYVEVPGHGIAIGAGEYVEERSTGSVGAWIEAKEGDEVRFSSSVDASREGWTGLDDPKDPVELWKLVVRKRVEREAPLPSKDADRELLLRRVTQGLFGESPTSGELASFIDDKAADALETLVTRLQARPRIEPFVGKLPTGEIMFRVIAADPNAAKAPRAANSPGRYVLGDSAHLLVSQLTEGDKRTNKAVIAFLSPDPKVASPHKPYEFALPDGIGTYGIVWDRGAGALWILQKDLVRKYEFTNPSQVQEMKIVPGSIINIPAHLQEPMKQAFNVVGGPVQQQNSQGPAAAGIPELPKLADEAYTKTGVHWQKFREEDAKFPGGERMGDVLEPTPVPEGAMVLGMRFASDAQWKIGGAARAQIAVRNASKDDVKFAQTPRLDNGFSVVAIDKDGKEHQASINQYDGLLVMNRLLLPANNMVGLKTFTLRFDAEKRDAGEPRVAAFHLPPGDYTLRCKWSDAHPLNAHEGEWTGELVSVDYRFTLAPAGAPKPAADAPKTGAMLPPATEQTLKWGEPVKGLRAALAIRHSSDTPKAGELPDLFVVVQNVSEAPIRFNDTLSGEKARHLYIKLDGNIQQGIWAKEPGMSDVTLQPREVVFVPMYSPEPARKDRGSWGALIAEGLMKDTRQSAVVNLTIEKAPAGAWTGKLVTGETSGAAAIGKTAAGDAGLGVPIPAKSAPALEWGVGKEGLSTAISVSRLETHIGGEVQVALWLRNSGTKNITFSKSGRTDVGLSVTATDKDGKAHNAEITSFRGYPVFGPLELPPGHVVKVKEFAVRFDAPGAERPPARVARFLLPAGAYQLSAKWSDTQSFAAREGEWRGELVSAGDEVKVAQSEVAAAPAATATDDLPPKGKDALDGPDAAGQQQNPQQHGVMLKPATEAQLDWGEAVNGLRGALIVRAPAAGKPQGIYLAVQNVSEAPLRFADTIKSEKLRTLYVSASGKILFALSNGEATQTDVVLQPREVAYLSMMLAENGGAEKEPTAVMIEGLRKDSLQTWRAVLAMERAPDGAWTGKLTTGETRGAVGDGGPQPKDAQARALFKVWQSSARLNGDIPGGLVALLHGKVKEFIRNNEPDASGGPFAQKMKPLEPRFANTGDWKAADVVALLDDIAAAHTIPLETTMEHISRHTLQRGLPLPAAFEKTDWGEPQPGGLRMAYVLEPRAKEYHLGSELKARILLHNSGKEPVAFVTTGFQQPGHTAKLAGGGDIKLDSTFWTTLGRMEAYRLAPGEYCEVYTPGLGIGAQSRDRDDWSNVRAGSWIQCAEGSDVVFTPGAAMLTYEHEPEANPDWWLGFITERLNREAPVPTDTKEREYLLYRVVRELYGAAPSTTEGDAFAADKSPDALKNLAALLAKHPWGTQSHGLIRAGTTTFRVLPPDADAAKRPRVTTNPGWFTLRDDVKFSVTRRAAGERAVNEASIIYYQKGKDSVIHKVELPDGYNTWAAGLKKGDTVLWVSEKGGLRKYDFTNPLKVEETRYEEDQAAPIPTEVREAMSAALGGPDAAVQQYEPLNPPPAAPADEASKPEKPKNGAAAKMPGASATNDPGAAQRPAATEYVTVDIQKDGSIAYGRKPVTLDELKTDAAQNVKKWFTIRADKDVPYAKVIEVVEAMKAGGVTEFSFSEARVGDGKYRVANRQDSYKFDDKHKFSICRPGEHPQWFTVSWPAEGERPACWLRTFPNVSAQTHGKWAVVWEPGTDVLWWVDDSDVGKMTLTDPAHVIVDREGRTNNFSRDFGLPEEVKTEFRRLGFVIGRDKTPGLETAIGGNTGGQTIVSAEAGNWIVEGTVTDADGKPLADVPIRVRTQYSPTVDLATTKTDKKGGYHVTFRLDLRTLARFRGVAVEPGIEGFTERDLARAGEFDALLHGAEKPQRINIRDYPEKWIVGAVKGESEPGPIPGFSEQKLLPEIPGRSDFVMLPAGEIAGQIVGADGKPLPNYFIAASATGQRAGYSVAYDSSGEDGLFRLKGIPANMPLIFTTNPGGKPGETSTSAPQRFEPAKPHIIRVTVPANSGDGAVKIESAGGGAAAPSAQPAPKAGTDANAAARTNPGRIETLHALVANRERALVITRKAAKAGVQSTAEVLKGTMELIEAKLDLARVEGRAGDEPQLLRELLAAQEQILAETRVLRKNGIVAETEVLDAERAVLQTKARLYDAAPTDPEQLATPMKTAHRLRVMDAGGTKPISEFRVVAGVPSGVSQEFEKAHGTKVAAWQSHTLRAGRDGAMLWPIAQGSYQEMILRVEADGFVPQHSGWIVKADGPKDLTFKMVEDKGVVGVAMLPQGRPAGGATVVLATAMRGAVLEGGLGEFRDANARTRETMRAMWDLPYKVIADENGEFILPNEPDPSAAVLITHGDGVLELPYTGFLKTPTVTLQPWGRLHGRVQWGEKPGAGETVDLTVHRDDYGYPGIVAQYANTKTDEKGQFVFEKVLPGLVQLSVPINLAEPGKEGVVSSVNLPGRLGQVTAKAGEHVSVLLGGRGRTVRGRLVGREVWAGVTFHFRPTAPHVGMPGDDAIGAAWGQFQKSERGPNFFRNGLKVAADGSFEILQVPPGNYQIFFSGADSKEQVANSRFTVPAEDHDVAPEPLDVGEIRARQ